MGGQSSKSRSSLPGLGAALKRSGMLERQIKPIRGQLFGQLSELLSTGGVGARVPIIQRAVEASQQATAQGLSRTREELGRSGIGGVFAQRALAEQRQSGAQQASQIPTALFQQMMEQLVPFLSQTQAGAFGVLPSLATTSRTQSSSAGGGVLSQCLAPETPILTPDGPVRVADLRVDDAVVTRDEKTGATLTATIDEIIVQDVPARHEFAVIAGHVISPAHPIAHDTIGQRAFVRVTAGDRGIATTHDIRIAAGTGEYFVPGVGWLKSTLDPRHTLLRQVA